MNSNPDGDTGEGLTGQPLMARELRAHRRQAGLSLGELARRVGYSRTYLSASEKPGAGLISANVVTRIDEELGANGALITVHAQADAERRSRRTSHPVVGAVTPVDMRAAPTTFGDVWGTEWADLAAVMQPNGVSGSIVEQAEQVVYQIHRQFAKVAPTEMLPVVNAHLRATTSLLAVGQPTAFRRRLCSIAGHLAGQRAWLLFDLRRADHAESWFRLALDPAKEADDDALVAWLLGGHSVVAFDRGDTRTSQQLLDRARQHASRVPDAPVAGWVDALEARALATVGEAVLARRSIARARRCAWRVAEDTYRHGMDVENGELNVDYYEGGSLLASGDAVPRERCWKRRSRRRVGNTSRAVRWSPCRLR